MAQGSRSLRDCLCGASDDRGRNARLAALRSRRYGIIMDRGRARMWGNHGCGSSVDYEAIACSCRVRSLKGASDDRGRAMVEDEGELLAAGRSPM